MTQLAGSDFETVAKALYGPGAWEIIKAESQTKKKQGLSNADKGLVAANAASAAIGVGTLNSLRKPVAENYRGTVKPSEAGGIPRQAARGARKLGVPGARKTLRGMNKLGRSKAGRAAIAGGLIGGAAFNTAADAASAVSIARKKKSVQPKVAKSAGLSKRAPRLVIRKADSAPPPNLRMKLKALQTGEKVAREKVPKLAARGKKAAGAAKDTWKAEAAVSKALDDKHEVYGWASITELNGQPVVDLQGDYVTIEEIEKAAHAYVTSSRKGGDMHARAGDGPKHVADLIESVVITDEKKEALGMPPDSPTGWWTGFKIHDEDTWNLVRDGKRPMFSIHGSGRRITREMD